MKELEEIIKVCPRPLRTFDLGAMLNSHFGTSFLQEEKAQGEEIPTLPDVPQNKLPDVRKETKGESRSSCTCACTWIYRMSGFAPHLVILPVLL